MSNPKMVPAPSAIPINRPRPSIFSNGSANRLGGQRLLDDPERNCFDAQRHICFSQTGIDRVVHCAIGVDFTLEDIVRNGDLVEFEGGLFLLFERFVQLGFHVHRRLILRSQDFARIPQGILKRPLQLIDLRGGLNGFGMLGT